MPTARLCMLMRAVLQRSRRLRLELLPCQCQTVQPVAEAMRTEAMDQFLHPAL